MEKNFSDYNWVRMIFSLIMVGGETLWMVRDVPEGGLMMIVINCW